MARMRAFSTPCCFPVNSRLASGVGCCVLSIVYLLWTLFLWQAYFALARIKTASSGTAATELAAIARFAIFAALFTTTWFLVSVGASVTVIFPQQDAARWLSRLIWVGWILTWGIGVYGVVSIVSMEAFVSSGCSKTGDCQAFRERLQLWLFFAVFATLAVVFYLGIIYSAYVHSLHPHLFKSPDSDSEDEYSDYEEELEMALEAEMRRARHPHTAGTALVRAVQRQQMRMAAMGYPATVFRQRSSSRARQPYAEGGISSASPSGSDWEEEEEEAQRLVQAEGGARRGSLQLAAISSDEEGGAMPPAYAGRLQFPPAATREASLGREQRRSGSHGRR
ncbi:hypothetical protein JCM10207_004620 [Rhodosporidiobolus poonsookiae]